MISYADSTVFGLSELNLPAGKSEVWRSVPTLHSLSELESYMQLELVVLKLFENFE